MSALIAHRGSHETEPENTLAAFEAATRNGADLIELDVRLTADRQLAIFHDPEVVRTSVNKVTLADLRRLSGIDVPVLEEVLAWAEEAGVGLDVELKENGYVDVVAPLLEAFCGPLIVTSFVDPVLAQLATAAPDVHRGLLLSFTPNNAVKRVRQCGAHAAVIEMRLLSDRVLSELAEAELGAFVWDFMPDAVGQREWLSDGRIAGFITDDVLGTHAALAPIQHTAPPQLAHVGLASATHAALAPVRRR